MAPAGTVPSASTAATSAAANRANLGMLTPRQRRASYFSVPRGRTGPLRRSGGLRSASVPPTVTAPDGAAIAYDTQGQGPDLVLVHGITESRRAWDPLLPR